MVYDKQAESLKVFGGISHEVFGSRMVFLQSVEYLGGLLVGVD